MKIHGHVGLDFHVSGQTVIHSMITKLVDDKSQEFKVDHEDGSSEYFIREDKGRYENEYRISKEKYKHIKNLRKVLAYMRENGID